MMKQLISCSLVAISASASAEPIDERVDNQPQQRMRAIDGGLEIAVGLSGAQSVGVVGDGMTAGDMIGAGGQLEIELGSRVAPNLAINFYSNGQLAGDDTYTGAAGIEADFHVRPYAAVDPWVSVGTGVRAYLRDEDGLAIGVGAELVRLQLGTDFRISEDIALSPVIGASATLFGAEKSPMEDFHELSNKGLAWTFTAGIAARFNTFGARK